METRSDCTEKALIYQYKNYKNGPFTSSNCRHALPACIMRYAGTGNHCFNQSVCTTEIKYSHTVTQSHVNCERRIEYLYDHKLKFKSGLLYTLLSPFLCN